MNENTRTAVFLAVAAAIVVATFVLPAMVGTRGGPGDAESLAKLEGTLLFPEFKDPLSAASLEVVRYNEQTGDRIPFKVAQVGGIWSIPSHENYPADAKDHLAAAAAELVDLKILGTAGNNRADHATYGVVDPTEKDLAPGTPGVGMKVVLADAKDTKLVSMIVGKEDAKTPGLRYVRREGQDAVLVVKLGTESLSTEFGDWIEKNLLKLTSWDIRDIFIQDYSIDEVQGHVLLSDEFTLGYDGSGDPKWKLVANRRFTKDGKWEDVKLGANEQLDAKRLDELQTALDDLKIVDVARKPAGLSADLAADKTFLNDQEAVGSLMERGFYPAHVGGKTGIYSNEGETRIRMKDGVEYVLRFGGIAGSGRAKKSADGKEKEGDDDGVNRYLFVMAEFNSEAIPKPKLQPLPTAPKEKPAEGEAEKKEAEKKPDDAKKTEPATEDKAATEKDKADAEAALAEERKQIEKENQREQEAYDEQIVEGKKKVAELNARFADWYYVISEDVYDKIHLGRDELIEPKAKPGDKSKTGVTKIPLPPDAFRSMQPGNE
ncbi:MAG TPA: DUF4340 domain-containing protein [Thermoguttaceae bacterium]|nr:DUF4340 domain-containing protein [Thermoguttaceae bacterium]